MVKFLIILIGLILIPIASAQWPGEFDHNGEWPLIPNPNNQSIGFVQKLLQRAGFINNNGEPVILDCYFYCLACNIELTNDWEQRPCQNNFPFCECYCSCILSCYVDIVDQ